MGADGLGKFAEALEIPRRGLWHRVPDVSQGELDEWERLYEEDQAQRKAEAQLAQAVSSTGAGAQRPPRRTRTPEGQ